MRKTLVFVLLSLVVLSLVSCQSLTDILKEKPVQNDQVTLTSEQEYSQTLLYLAPTFAKVLARHPDLKRVIHEEVGKMFDGDYDVLYNNVAYTPCEDNYTLEQALLEQDSNSINMIKSIPFFNISIPANYDKWLEYQGPMYVIPLRYDIDDLEVKELPGYNSETGEVVSFTAAKAPEFPVIVIGINERTELIGKMIEPIDIVPEEEPITPAYTSHTERLRSIRLYNNLEPWFWSEPEVYCLYAVGNNYIGLKEYYSFNPFVWWFRHYYNSSLFTYQDQVNTLYYKLRLMEEDYIPGTQITYTLRGSYVIGGVTYYINHTFWICRYDDVFGECMPYFYHSNPQSYYLNYYGWTNANVEMAY